MASICSGSPLISQAGPITAPSPWQSDPLNPTAQKSIHRFKIELQRPRPARCSTEGEAEAGEEAAPEL